MLNNPVTFEQELQRKRLEGFTASDIDQRTDQAKSTQEAKKADQASNPANGVDPIVLAFYLLMEAANTTANTAIIQSKQLSANASAQQRLNAQAGALQWYSIPKLQTNHHHITEHNTHWTWDWTKHWAFHYTTTKTKNWTTHPNATLVNQAQVKNQEVSAMRQTMADRLSVLQQNAQIGESQVDTISDESMQSMQIGASLMQMLQGLTYQALMRHQPQG